jgi:DNA-binding beta-propeller fold protein YncE
LATILGQGEYLYQELADWAKLPDDWDFREVVDVIVDAQDRVYVFNRGEHPLIIFEQNGTFVGSWGEGLFTRPHGLTLVLEGKQAGQDPVLFCVDDDGHWIGKFSLDGKLLMQIGERGKSAPPGSRRPFNRPTKVAQDPKSGELYISDGYGNPCVHKYSADGQYLFSWGDYGTEAGAFNLPHSVCTDAEGKVYVADRENHRVQVFDDQGNYLDQWNNLHRPCGLYIKGDRAYIGQLPTHLDVNVDYPNIGACVTIHDLSGKQLARLGDARVGEEPGQFTAPHSIAVDSRGDLYIGEVSWSAYGRRLASPRTARSFRKLIRQK